MGLDMFLDNKIFLINSNSSDADKIKQINAVFGIEGDEDNDYGVKEVTFNVAYWRKANSIHAWFVKNVQDGKDECQESWVSREVLEELVEICKQVIEKPELSRDLLPPQPGFFFGNTEIDESYFQNLDKTVYSLQKALSDPALMKGEFFYHASW